MERYGSLACWAPASFFLDRGDDGPTESHTCHWHSVWPRWVLPANSSGTSLGLHFQHLRPRMKPALPLPNASTLLPHWPSLAPHLSQSSHARILSITPHAGPLDPQSPCLEHVFPFPVLSGAEVICPAVRPAVWMCAPERSVAGLSN